MTRSLQSGSRIIGRAVRAIDEAVGAVDDLLFDDRHWGVRWLVIDTGHWLPGRKVLLPPSAAKDDQNPVGGVSVELSRESIENAPGLETDEPVSRQLESDVYGYYGWAPYWEGGFGYPAGMAGMGAAIPPAGVVPPATPAGSAQSAREPSGDPNLRSSNEVTGYYVKASDGDIGHVEDMLIDVDDWAIRYLVIDTRNWWPGKKVLISPEWLSSIDWSLTSVSVDATRQKIKDSPEYDPADHVERDYEDRLHAHYGFSPYWAGPI